MALELFLSVNVRRQKQFASWIPVCIEDYDLPNCTVKVFEKGVDESLYNSKGIRWRDYSSDPGTVRLFGSCYYAVPASDGLVLQAGNEPEGIVFIQNNYASIEMIADTMHASRSMCYDILLHAYQFVAVCAGALLMHAAAVVYKDEAILFCGVSGAGKSTQSSHWVKYYNARPINFDHPCIVWKNDIPYVYSTPWGGKENVCMPDSAPVKAIVFVHKNEKSEVYRLSKAEAFGRLVLNNALPDVCSEMNEKMYSVVEKLAKCVPVYHQEGTLTREAPDVLHRVLYGD